MKSAIRVLIIKTGNSETFDLGVSNTPSLGDVLRTTPILHAIRERYPTAVITWCTSKEAAPLLSGASYIDHLLIWDQFTILQLQRQVFDVVINLEKVPGIAALIRSMICDIKLGFGFDPGTGDYTSFYSNKHFDKLMDNVIQEPYQKILVEMLDVEWKEQPYLIAQPTSTLRSSRMIGLNKYVGSKWPTKNMTPGTWEILGKMIEQRRSRSAVSHQPKTTDLQEYINWINSCALIVTPDTLGLHIALALGKPVVALFGPTSEEQIHFYTPHHIVYDRRRPSCMPCYQSKCTQDILCMNNIDLDDITKAAEQLLEV